MIDVDFRPHEMTWTPERVARLWGYYAANRGYDGQYFAFHSGRAILEQVRARIPLAGRRVVDFGCGPGFMIQHLVDAGIACEGIEFSSESAGEALRKFGGHALFRGIHIAKDLPFPFDDQSIDVVLLTEVMEHVLDDQLLATAEEVGRVLRVGGHAVVTTPHSEDLEASKVQCPECGCVFHRWQHQRSFTADSLSSLMERVGLKTVECRPTTFQPRGRLDPLRRLSRWLRRQPDPPLPSLLYIGERT